MDHVIPLTNENAPIKYSSLEAAAAQRKQRENNTPDRNSHKSRYSSDPCKILGGGIALLGGIDECGDFPSVPAPPTPIGKTPAFDFKDEDVMDGKLTKHLQPAVDEDDYLQPSSTSQIPKYMDLVQDGKY